MTIKNQPAEWFDRLFSLKRKRRGKAIQSTQFKFVIINEVGNHKVFSSLLRSLQLGYFLAKSDEVEVNRICSILDKLEIKFVRRKSSSSANESKSLRYSKKFLKNHKALQLQKLSSSQSALRGIFPPIVLPDFPRRKRNFILEMENFSPGLIMTIG